MRQARRHLPERGEFRRGRRLQREFALGRDVLQRAGDLGALAAAGGDARGLAQPHPAAIGAAEAEFRAGRGLAPQPVGDVGAERQGLRVDAALPPARPQRRLLRPAGQPFDAGADLGQPQRAAGLDQAAIADRRQRFIERGGASRRRCGVTAQQRQAERADADQGGGEETEPGGFGRRGTAGRIVEGRQHQQVAARRQAGQRQRGQAIARRPAGGCLATRRQRPERGGQGRAAGRQRHAVDPQQGKPQSGQQGRIAQRPVEPPRVDRRHHDPGEAAARIGQRPGRQQAARAARQVEQRRGEQRLGAAAAMQAEGVAIGEGGADQRRMGRPGDAAGGVGGGGELQPVAADRLGGGALGGGDRGTLLPGLRRVALFGRGHGLGGGLDRRGDQVAGAAGGALRGGARRRLGGIGAPGRVDPGGAAGEAGHNHPAEDGEPSRSCCCGLPVAVDGDAASLAGVWLRPATEVPNRTAHPPPRPMAPEKA